MSLYSVRYEVRLGLLAFSFAVDIHVYTIFFFNPLNAKLNTICNLLALLGGAAIVVVRSLRVNIWRTVPSSANVFHTSELLASIHSSVTGYHE